MRIVIAGGKPSSRRAVRLLVNTRLGIEDVSEAGNYEELMKLVEAVEPDLILLDSELPGVNLNEIIATLCELDHSPSVFVLNERLELEAEILAAGADTFIYKGNNPNQLLIAIEDKRIQRRDHLLR